MKLVKLIFILIFTSNLSASFLSDKDKLIVTHPYFEKDGDKIYSYFGVEENIGKTKRSYVIKFDIKENKIVQNKELDSADLDIRGNIQSIKYKDKEAYVVFLTKDYLNKVVIFDKDLNILHIKNISSSSEIKNSGIVADMDSDGLLDIVFQTNEYLHILLKNPNDEGFTEIKDDLNTDSQNRNATLYTRVGKPYILNNGKKKVIIVYFTQYNPRKRDFINSFISFYELENDKFFRKTYHFNTQGHRANLDIKNIKDKIYFTFPLIGHIFKSGELVFNGNIEDVKFDKVNQLEPIFYISDSMTYFHEISHRIINFRDEAYYVMVDKSGKYINNKLYFVRLSDRQVVKKVEKYIPYESIKIDSASFRTSIDLSLIFDKENSNYDTYVNERVDNNMYFISPINNENIKLSENIEDTSSKYIFATENNITYLLSYNKESIFSKKLDSEKIIFAPFKNYNNLFNESNYIMTTDSLKNIIYNLNNIPKNELNYLYKITNNDIFYELYKKFDTIKAMLKYKQVDKIDEKLYNYFSKEFQNDKDNLIFNSIFINKILSSFNHSFENYFDNLNELKELDGLINDKRVKKLKELYINCNESFRLYKELKKEEQLKIDDRFKEIAKSFEYLKGGECKELLNDINSLIKERDRVNLVYKIIQAVLIISVIIFIVFILYKNRIQIKIWWINREYRKKQYLNFNEFYLLNSQNLFNYLKAKNIENDYRKSFPIEDEYFEKTSKLQIINKTSQYFIDTFYTNLIMIYNREPYRNNPKLEIKTDEAFIFALRKLEKLLQLQLFKSYFSIIEACCQFIYINPKDKKNKHFIRKPISLKENMLFDEFKEIKINTDLQNYFIKNYQLNSNYSFSEKSKILKFLFNYIDIDNLKEKIISLNNLTFEKENISELKNKYLVTSLQSDKSILKTFQALSLKDNIKVIIRYYDKNSQYNYVTKAEKGVRFNGVKFIDMYEFIEGKMNNISIENFAEGESLPKLIKNKTISDFKIKELIKRLIDYVEHLIEKENINYLPNLHPYHLFYDKKNDKLMIVCNGHNKALIDRDVIIKGIMEIQEFFQTPEFRKHIEPNNLMNSIIKDITIGNKKLLDKELIYQIAMTLYAFLQGTLPYKYRGDDITNENYKIEFKKYEMKDSDKLEELLNSVLDTKPNSFKEVYERLSLSEFKLKLGDIFFNNINPFEAGRKLEYKNYKEVIIKRDITISEVINEIIKNKSRNFFIQSNKRMGKSTFLSQIEYEAKYIENKKLYAVYIVLNEMNLKEPLFYNIANTIYKAIINEDIKTYYKSPNLEEFSKNEFEAFVNYTKYIISLSERELILLIDEFEDTLITLYDLHQKGEIKHFSYNYIVNFKNIVDRVDGIYNFLVSSVDFKLLKDKTEGFNPESLNNVYPVILPTLTIDETKELMNNEKIINDGLKFSDELIEEVFTETNGHPLFIQNICHEIIEFKNKSRDETYEIDKAYFEKNKIEIYEKLFKSQENAFKELWDKVLTEKEREILKDIVKNRLNYSNVEQELIEVLENSFLIKEVTHKQHIISIPIFEEWIEKNKLRFDND